MDKDTRVVKDLLSMMFGPLGVLVVIIIAVGLAMEWLSAVWETYGGVLLTVLAVLLVIWFIVRRLRVRQQAHPREWWRSLLNRSDVFILDTETTGLGTRAEVIELAILDTTGREVLHVLSLPAGRISAKAAEVNGWSRVRLREAGAQPWPEVHAEVAAVLSKAAMVLAWNAPFDSRLLAQTAERHELMLPEIKWHDLLEDYRELRSGGRHRLVDAVEREGVPEHEAHTALGDCRAALAVMWAVTRDERREMDMRRKQQRNRAAASTE